MIHSKHMEKIVSKLKRAMHTYAAYAETPVCDLPCTLFETAEHYTLPPAAERAEITPGTIWGGEYGYGWFQTRFTVPQQLHEQRCYLKQETGAVECLVFIDGHPVGEFDNCADYPAHARLHTRFLLKEAAAGTTYEIDLEAYAGHLDTGMHVGDPVQTDPETKRRTFRSVSIVTVDEEIQGFVLDLRLLLQMFDLLPDTNAFRGSVQNCLLDVYAAVSQLPAELQTREEAGDAVRKARERMRAVLSEPNAPTSFEIGLVGHGGSGLRSSAQHKDNLETDTNLDCNMRK